MVKEVYVVRGDVGPYTGNIESAGSVDVHGQVMDGYKIISGGSISISHDVGACHLEAEGDIRISLGVYGKNKAKIISKHGSIQAKYIQEAFVMAEQEVLISESLIRCDVNSNTRVLLSGNKGKIVGGTTRALNEIYCKEAGAVSGANTVLEIDLLPEIRIGFLKYSKLLKRG